MTSKLLQDFHIVIDIPVAWGDMDAFEHVNNAKYFTYFESGRIAYFRHIGSFGKLSENPIAPILAWADCRFRLPVTFPDTVSVGTRIQEIGEDRFVIVQRIVSQEHEKIAAEGSSLIVSYDYENGRKTPIPAVWREKIVALDHPAEMENPS